MKKCKTCNDKYFINSNDKDGNYEIQKCDDCNYFKSDKEAKNHQKAKLTRPS